MPRARIGILAATLLAVATPAAAQLWEIQLGGVGTYGSDGSRGFGAGPVIGVAPGRLAYAGLRWTYYAGSTSTQGVAPSATEVRDQMQSLALDLALVIPKGGVDIMPGFGIGGARYVQDARASGSGAAWTTATTTEVFFTPGVAVQIPIGNFALIPEIQYCIGPHPRVPYPVEHQGLLLSVRAVITFETDRIRQ